MSSPNGPVIQMSMMVGLVSSDHQGWQGYGHQYAKFARSKSHWNPNDTIPWNDQPTTNSSLIPVGEGQALVLIGIDSYSGYGFDIPVCNASIKTTHCILTEPYTPSQHLHRIASDTAKEIEPCIHNPGIHWSGDVPIT